MIQVYKLHVTSKGQENRMCPWSSLHTNFTMKEAIHCANDRGSTVHVACLDIEKSFDKVWQNGLLYKLHEKGINSTLWQIYADSFKTFKLYVSIKGQRSKWFIVGQRVHQGGVLSSLLFQILFDDLLKRYEE